MSDAYFFEYSKATEKTAFMPYSEKKIEELDRAAVSSKAKSVFAAFKKKSKGVV